MLDSWNASVKTPEKVLFLKYEDMKADDPFRTLKKIASFTGVPFSEEEERDRAVEEIANLCSLSNMKKLEVSRTRKGKHMDNKHFFRKGEVGDWVNYFTPSMAERMQRLMEEI
ncbi:cytosolic sulfotransferase 15-like [Punica granatum]|uniref:Sulfotransferase n=1 Tax=Punica granatum TaxID=22663 RepID=A0A218XZI2_PUNGR|nr:cytosolic sulfotransferase 15-like [Punica granatum]OWM90056.1 hypothetical protein CDL15_Pgr026969 [Punica granatum]